MAEVDFVIEKINASHRTAEFECGIDSMTSWVKRFALTSSRSDITQTYVLHRRDNQVLGYYALSAGDVNREAAPERIAKGMPNYPIGVVVLTRLAVDVRLQGQGFGSTLLNDALARIERVAETVGIRAILTHAINEAARAFYLRQGFLECPLDRFHLMLPMKDLRASMRATKGH